MRLARELCMHLHDLYGWPGPLTHRQFLAWQEWLDDQWCEPDRHDWYQMQTAYVVARSMGGSRASLNEFKLDFKSARETRDVSRMPISQETAWAQAKWFARMTMPVKVVKADG
jgi:hypothetical protein